MWTPGLKTGLDWLLPNSHSFVESVRVGRHTPLSFSSAHQVLWRCVTTPMKHFRSSQWGCGGLLLLRQSKCWVWDTRKDVSGSKRKAKPCCQILRWSCLDVSRRCFNLSDLLVHKTQCIQMKPLQTSPFSVAGPHLARDGSVLVPGRVRDWN